MSKWTKPWKYYEPKVKGNMIHIITKGARSDSDGYVDVECGEFVHKELTLDYDTCNGLLDNGNLAMSNEEWLEWVDETQEFLQQNNNCVVCNKGFENFSCYVFFAHNWVKEGGR